MIWLSRFYKYTLEANDESEKTLKLTYLGIDGGQK
jgi:hypothetical protein